MIHFIEKLLLLLILSVGAQASSGLYQNHLITISPKIISISADQTLVELSEYDNTQLSITGIFKGRSEDITQKASYLSHDNSVINVEKGLISGLKEGSTTLKVSYRGKHITIAVEIYETVDGYLLPHAPQNPNVTLLGVDSNHNGLRDDVERWIHKDMSTFRHPKIERMIAVSQAKAYQAVLLDPKNTDNQVLEAITKASNCWQYYARLKDIPINGATDQFGNKLRDKQFNTKKRLNIYLDYDSAFRGKVFIVAQTHLFNTGCCEDNIKVVKMLYP